jgi:hypothetical protein
VLVFFALSAIDVSQAGDPASVFSSTSSDVAKLEGKYEGAWVTTKSQKLDGTASCEVKQLSKDHWQCRFWGESQQKPFDYKVDFSADSGDNSSPTDGNRSIVKNGAVLVRGEAKIDGIHYDAAGELHADEFKLHFTSDRYEGSVLLKRALEQKPVPKNGK